MSTPNLKFRTMWYKDEIGNGYRMATVAEVRNHFDTIARLGIPPLHPHHPMDEGKKMYLVDGYMTYPSHHHFQIQPTFHRFVSWKVVVKEKEWDEDEGRWRSKSSACYPSEGVFLRKHVYDHLTLSPQARLTALLTCSDCCDVEVFHWLLKTTSTAQELTHFISSLDKTFAHHHTFKELVKYLLSKFSFQLPMELVSDCNTAIDLAIEVDRYRNLETVLRVVDLFVELFSAEIAHWENSNGMSFLESAAKESHIPIFTKLLSVSPQPLVNHVLSIKPRFQAVFSEAFRRDYVSLLQKLLDFIREMTIDIPLLIRDLSQSVEGRHAPLVDKLLEFKKVNEQINMDEFVEVFGKAVCKGHNECMQKLLELLVSKVEEKIVWEVDGNEKTLIQYAAEYGDGQIFHLLVQKLQSHGSILQGGREESQNPSRNRDKFGRSILHWASLVGEADICEICVKDWKLKVETKDISGQNSLHFAAKGILGHQVVDRIKDFFSRELIHSTDYKGRTPLHLAAAVGNIQMVKKLLLLVEDSQSELKYIQQSDRFGRSGLHMAARGGHSQLVHLFLEKGVQPLEERDINQQTALHYATQAEDPGVAVALSKRLMHIYDSDLENKSLFMWASAAGIGTAEEKEQTHPYIRSFFEKEKASDETHLLRAAAVKNKVEMAWELVNRGAKLEDLQDLNWKERLSAEKKENVENVIKQIELANKRGHDKPSLEDKLGRSIFAEGLAALFLNKFIESPITVGISGDWGMGKSSLMIQTEQILLMAASQLTFPNLLMLEKFRGAQEISLNKNGLQIYQHFIKGVGKLLGQKEKYSFQTENPLVNLLKRYQPRYHEIYKSLACMDQNQMLKLKKNQSIVQSQSQVLRGVPRILTIQYNAWHYRDEKEAWAGLAVRISEEIEKSMTRAQRFTTLWKYTWNQHRMSICLQLFIPCLFATFIAGWVAWGAWILLSKGKLKELKFGSIPCTVVAIVWAVLKSVISVVKPVSEQMRGYITSPDHSSSLGYQQKVISDINFLKKEIGRKPGWFFTFISGEWCSNWFGLYPDNIENTCISKFQPASEDHLRIITFVDDLDRCEEKVILQVLSAINLVLAECKVNVILGMDKKMIERAIKRNFEDNDDQDLADRFISKIIQIPLSLPDPMEEELNSFLENQLGHPPPTLNSDQDGEETDYGEIESDVEGYTTESRRQSNGNQNIVASAVLDICCSSETQTSCQGMIKNVINCCWIFLKSLYLVVLNILIKFWHFECKSNLEKINPLTFSKGARLSREMLLSNYSNEEAKIFYGLKSFATDNQKLPREWKRLLNYHKLAFNILSRQGKVYSLPGWKEQLVAWIFVCWQWKHEMNTLFKDWHKYAVVNDTKATEDEIDNHEHWHGPSLKTIVTNYINKLGDSLHSANSHVEGKQDNQSHGPMEKEDLMRLKDCLRQDPFIKAILSLYRYDITSVKEDENYYRSWLNIKAALGKQDVTMKGIQLFQQFRLHCETCHLPWPLPPSYERAASSKYMEA